MNVEVTARQTWPEASSADVASPNWWVVATAMAPIANGLSLVWNDPCRICIMRNTMTQRVARLSVAGDFRSSSIATRTSIGLGTPARPQDGPHGLHHPAEPGV